MPEPTDEKMLRDLVSSHTPDYRQHITMAVCDCRWSEIDDPSGMTWAAHVAAVLTAAGYARPVPAPEQAADRDALARVRQYLGDLDGFYGGEPIDDVLDRADGGPTSPALLLSDVRALAARPAPDVVPAEKAADRDTCPRDGQPVAWHLAVESGADGKPRTNGEFMGCDFGATTPAGSADRDALVEVRTHDHVAREFWRESEQAWVRATTIRLSDRPTRWRYRAVRETLLRGEWRPTEQEARADLAAARPVLGL